MENYKAVESPTEKLEIRPSGSLVEPKGEVLASLAKAMAKVQGNMLAAKKDKENPFFKSKYSDLASCWEACRVPLSENGIAVIQMPYNGSGFNVGIETYLIHESGQFLTSRFETTPKDKSTQAQGSALTYLRRYTLCAMVGISPDDDDGNAASGKIGGNQSNHYEPYRDSNARTANTTYTKPAQATKNESSKPKVEIYNDNNAEHVKRLEEFLLKQNKIPKENFHLVAELLNGKPISNVNDIIKQVIAASPKGG